MADENRIHIEITGDPSGAVAATGAVNKATHQLSDGTKTALSGMKGYYDSFRKNWLDVTAGITAGYLAARKALEMVAAADKVADQIEALDALGAKWGTTGSAIIAHSKAAAHGLLSVSDAAAISSKALLAGINPTQLESMIPLAERLSEVWGTDVASAFDTLSTAAMTGRDRMLKSLGVTLDLKAAHEEYARSMGVSASMLDGETKMMVGLNAISARQADLMKALPKYQDDSTKAYERAQIAVAGLSRAVGTTLMSAMGSAYELLQKYPATIAFATAAISALAIASSTAAANLGIALVGALISAATAAKAFTASLLSNPLILAFAVAVGVAAGAFVHFRREAEEAKKAQDDFVASFRRDGLENTKTMAEVLSDDLLRARTSLAAWKEQASTLSRTRWGWDAELNAARDATGYWGKEVQRLEGLLKGATAAEKELSATAEQAAKEKARQLAEIRKEQAAAEADRQRKEREQITRTLQDQTKKSKTAPVGRIAEIEAEAALYREKGVSESVVDAWVAAEKVKASAKAHEQIEAFISGEQQSEMNRLDVELDKYRRSGASKEDIDRARMAGLERIQREYGKTLLEESIRNKEAENAILESMDQQALRMGVITHAEATRAKYDREREVLRLRMEQELALSQVAGISAAEKMKHKAEYERIEQQFFDTRRREADDLNNTLIEQETILLNLARERANAEREHTAQRLQSMMSGLQGIAGAAGAGFSGLAQGVGDLGGFAAGADPYTEQLAQLDSYHQQKLEKLRLQAQSELEAKAAAGASEDELFASRQQWQAEMLDAYRQWDAESAQTTEQRKLAIASVSMGTMGSLAESLYNLSGQKNKAAFNAMKAFRVAETIIDTYKAAQGSYAALSGIPIVGPALGAAAAAAAILSGMARVRQIQSMQPGGGASASGGGVGSPSMPSIPSPPASSTAAGEEENKSSSSPIYNIHVYGNIVDHDQFARELVPALEKARADGAR